MLFRLWSCDAGSRVAGYIFRVLVKLGCWLVMQQISRAVDTKSTGGWGGRDSLTSNSLYLQTPKMEAIYASELPLKPPTLWGICCFVQCPKYIYGPKLKNQFLGPIWSICDDTKKPKKLAQALLFSPAFERCPIRVSAGIQTPDFMVFLQERARIILCHDHFFACLFIQSFGAT